MSPHFSIMKTMIISICLMVGLAMPATADSEFDKKVEGWNKEIGEQLSGLGDFMNDFGKNMGDGVKTFTPSTKKKAPRSDNITTGSISPKKNAPQVVAISEKYGSGTIVVQTSTRKLYYVLSPGRAIQYGVGVGRDGFQWGGVSYISRKKEWPSWRPPAEMIERERVKNNREIPEFMPGGPENPLGARALYLGSTLYRIHGTNQAQTIGGAVSSGCIRMRNQDVIDLYERASIGSKVYVYH